MSFNSVFQEYPLKVVSVNDFLLNMNELLWRKISIESFDYFEINPQLDISFETDPDLNKNNSEEIIILFVDSNVYKEQISNSNIKQIKNIVILNRQINLFSAHETEKYYDLVINSKRWIFHGIRDNNFNKNTTRKGFENQNSQNEKESFFLILNLEEKLIKQKIMKGFNRLIESFDDNNQSGKTNEFIIDFENVLRPFQQNCFEKQFNSALFTVTFKSFTIQKYQIQIESKDNENSRSNKFNNILNHFKKIISKNQAPLVENSNSNYFFMENLPYLLCCTSNDINNKMNYARFNDENYAQNQFYLNDFSNNLKLVYSNLNVKSNGENLEGKKTRYMNLKSNQMKPVPSLQFGFCTLNEKNHQENLINCKNHLQFNNKLSNISEHPCIKDAEFKSITSSIYTKSITKNGTKIKKSKPFVPFETSLSSVSISLTEVIKKMPSTVEKYTPKFKESEKLLENEESFEGPDTKLIKTRMRSDIKTEYGKSNKKEPCFNSRRFVLVKDEKITRHPALIKKCLESKSYDIIKEQHKQENSRKLHFKDKNNRHTVYMDSFDPKTKKNIYSNQKFNYELKSSKTAEKDLIDFSENMGKENSFTHLYQQNILNKESRPKSISKFFTRQIRSRKVSPPPPIEISPNGLLSPPPPSEPFLCKKNRTSNRNVYFGKLNKTITNEKFDLIIDSNDIDKQSPYTFLKNGERLIEPNIHSTVQTSKNYLNKKCFEGDINSVTYSFKKFSKIDNNSNQTMIF